MTSTVHLLAGPDAGRGRAGGAHEVVVGTLRAEGADVVEITGADASASVAAATQAVAAGAERLVVLGGDGLVHLGLQAVAGTDAILGIVPVGTGNDFARGLPDVPTDPAAAARAALGDSTTIDAIRVGEPSEPDPKWVASVATAGFSVDVNERANRLRFPKGPSRYTVATMVELPGLALRRTTLVVDGDAHEYATGLLAVGNTGWFGGGMHICPEADPADGLLDITVVADVGRLELLRFFRLVFSGRHLDHPKVHTHRGHEVRIGSSGMALWGDGEPIGTSDAGSFVLRAIPGALRVAMGASADPAR